ncbi:nuclear transport factor 2 family protein [Dactylosporangium sp. CA-139066]|uniref:nuclear transport factor 2 family protein n=1 Tax=Dactylosporangium sp. CA-139066 TaxID=3239930 RepID=UPI003D8BFD49
MESLIRRYFDMWNSGDASAAAGILAPAWVDHGHPEVATPADVAAAVARIRAARPGLRFELDSVAGPVAVGRAVDGDADPTLLAWVFTAEGDRLTSLRTYRAMA